MAETKSLEVGDLVIDPKTGGEIGIVYEIDRDPPDDAWLRMQRDARYRKLAGKQDQLRWVSAFSLSVGTVALAEPLVKSLRKATRDEIRGMEELFPFLKNDTKKLIAKKRASSWRHT